MPEIPFPIMTIELLGLFEVIKLKYNF